MGLKAGWRGSEPRFAAYVEALSSALGHADRAAPFHLYCAGLLLPGDRKSVERWQPACSQDGCRPHISRCTTSWQKPVVG